MSCQSYAPYREFKIDVQVTTGKTLCLHSVGRRYKVSWTISSCGQSAQKVASFPERLEFLSEQEAFRYAEGQRIRSSTACFLRTYRAILKARRRMLQSAESIVKREGRPAQCR